MRKLNENLVYNTDEDDCLSKNDLLNIYRLQKQLLIQENLVASIQECCNIWQKYSWDLSAIWLFFPDNDEDILNNIKSSDYFTTFEEYAII